MKLWNAVPAKKWGCGLAGVLLCAGACLVPPPPDLAACALAAGSDGAAAMRILGITLLAILWWAGEVVPDWLATIAMLLLWVLMGGLTFQGAFASFAGSSVWLIVGAFCLAAGITKTGFFRRISWFLIRLFSPTFRGQVLALLLVGTVCAPLVPSATAKAVLGATIANNIADAMGYGPNSKGRCGLFLASFIGFSATTPAFMSGSIFTYTLLGALPEATRAGVDWTSWFVACIPWLAVLLVGFFLAIQVMFRPDRAAALSPAYVDEQYRSLGPMRGKETLSAVLLALSVLLWILESRLGVSAAVTALGAAFFCFASGILDAKELSTAVPWGLVIFLGGVLNLGNVLSAVGIDLWLQTLLSPLFSGITGPALIVAAIAVLVVALRLILVSQSATVIVVIATLAPATAALGLSPFLVGFITLAAEQCWFLSYQNVVFVPALSCMEGTVRHRETVPACWVFEAVSLVGCLVSIPYWRLLGYL